MRELLDELLLGSYYQLHQHSVHKLKSLTLLLKTGKLDFQTGCMTLFGNEISKSIIYMQDIICSRTNVLLQHNGGSEY